MGLWLAGYKVILRSMEEQDKDMLFNLTKEQDMVKVTGGYPRPGASAHPVSWLDASTHSADSLHTIIADKKAPRTGLGIIVLSHMNQKGKEAEIYIKLLKSARGRGYGEDGVNVITAYGFGELGLDAIYSNILESNKASERLFEKCGFWKKSMHQSRGYEQGELRNVWTYWKQSEAGVHAPHGVTMEAE